MFVRFRETVRRLQVSLSSTRRDGGKVRHEHVASLGSAPLSPSAADRIAFWIKLHQRLEALGNRIDAAAQGAILTAIHARIPMPTMDDHQAEQLERARADARFWEALAEMESGGVEGHKELLALTQRTIAEREPLAADNAAKAEAAKARLAGGGGEGRDRQRHPRADDPKGLSVDLRHDGGSVAALRASRRDR